MSAPKANIGDLLYLCKDSLMYLDKESSDWDVCALNTMVILIAAHKWHATYIFECLTTQCFVRFGRCVL